MRIRSLVLGLLVAGVALYFTFRDVSLAEIATSLVHLRYGYVLVALVLFAAAFSIRALRWHFFCKALKPVPVRRLYSPMMIGFMGNLLPLRAGEFIRAYLFGKREEISFSASLGTIVVERLFDMISVLCLFGCLLVWNPVAFVPRGGQAEAVEVSGYMRTFGVLSLVGVAGIVFFCMLLLLKRDTAFRLVRALTGVLPPRFRSGIEEALESFTAGLGILRDARGIALSILLSALLWTVLCLTYYPFYWAYGIHPLLPLDSVFTLMVVTCVLISIMPTPGYLGPFQFGITFVLADLYGLERSVAASFSMVNWFVTMGSIFLVGLFFLLRDNLSFSELFARARELSRTGKGAAASEQSLLSEEGCRKTPSREAGEKCPDARRAKMGTHPKDGVSDPWKDKS
ncbi:MAG: lysylphosphatidylglycerol synthase transmembrane domain-containing protein [bacterium]